MTCNYTITAPEGYKVLAEFRDFYVHPSDPFIIEGSLIGGYLPIDNYTSEDETMEISFTTDTGFARKGFWLQLSAYDCTGMTLFLYINLNT